LYPTLKEYMDLTEYELTEMQRKIFLVLYGGSGLIIPLLLQNPQFLVGSFVNMLLVASAFKLDFKNILPVIILPSIGVVLGGALFGNFTPALLLMVPFIWIGNSILVLSIKYLKIAKKMNFALALLGGSCAKAGFLFACAFLLNSIGAVPAMFLSAMGIIQLVTAIIGGSAAFGVNKFLK